MSAVLLPFLKRRGDIHGQSDVVVASVHDPVNFAYHSLTADVNLDGRTDHWHTDNGTGDWLPNHQPGQFTIDFSGYAGIAVDNTNSVEAVVFPGDMNPMKHRYCHLRMQAACSVPAITHGTPRHRHLISAIQCLFSRRQPQSGESVRASFR